MEILAHRGASGTAPENTIAAFKKALIDGCDGFEFDVQQTKDGKIVVFHDWTLERTSNGQGHLRDYTLEELKKLDVGSWFSDEFKGEQIPTLEETLDIIPDDKLINIELKEEHSVERGTENKVLEIIKRYPNKNIIVSSFSHNLLKNLKELDIKLSEISLDEDEELKFKKTKIGDSLVFLSKACKKCDVNLEKIEFLENINSIFKLKKYLSMDKKIIESKFDFIKKEGEILYFLMELETS